MKVKSCAGLGTRQGGSRALAAPLAAGAEPERVTRTGKDGEICPGIHAVLNRFGKE